jgi:hypothetical protein
MPPSDRNALLRLAAETELVVAESADSDDSSVAQKHVAALLKLGETRARLGDWKAAESVLQEAVEEGLKLGSDAGRSVSTYSMNLLAAKAAADGHSSEALTIFDRMIEMNGGFPTFEAAPRRLVSTLDLWLTLLETIKDWERLYAASGVALGLLDPPASPEHRVERGKALMWRGRCAEHLGQNEEALDLYEQAIAQLEGEEDLLNADNFYNWAITRAVSLYADLGRSEEADAMALLARAKGKRPVAKGLRALARVSRRLSD